MNVIRVRHLYFSQYNRGEGISNLSFDIGKGDILVVTGDNGIGKSTLLKIIAGLTEYSSGEVTKPPICDIGYLGHKPASVDSLSVQDNLYMWSQWYQSYNLIDDAISAFCLGDFLYKKYERLSAGLKKRVALSRILMTRSKLWLLDEPFVYLDQYGREMLCKIIDEHRAQVVSVILTTNIDLGSLLGNTQMLLL